MKVETKEEPITCDLLSRQRTVIMGLAILSVIFFHYTDDCMTYKMYNEGFIKWYWIYVKSSGVDIFLFLSGVGMYHSYSSKIKNKQSVFYWLFKRYIRIICPLFILITPFLFYNIIYNDQAVYIAILQLSGIGSLLVLARYGLSLVS